MVVFFLFLSLALPGLGGATVLSPGPKVGLGLGLGLGFSPMGTCMDSTDVTHLIVTPSKATGMSFSSAIQNW